MSLSTTNCYSWQVCFWLSFFSFTVLMQYASIMSLSTLPILEGTSRCPSFSCVTIVYCSRQSQASPRFLVNPDVGNRASTKVFCSHKSLPVLPFLDDVENHFSVSLLTCATWDQKCGQVESGLEVSLGPKTFPEGGSPPLRLVAEPPLLGPPPPHHPSLVPTGRGSRVTGRYSLLRRPLPRLLVTFLPLWVACWPEREELLSGVGSLFFKRVLQIDHTGENWMSSCQGHEVIMIKISQCISAAVTRLPFKRHLNGANFGYMPLLSSCLNSEPILSTHRSPRIAGQTSCQRHRPGSWTTQLIGQGHATGCILCQRRLCKWTQNASWLCRWNLYPSGSSAVLCFTKSLEECLMLIP